MKKKIFIDFDGVLNTYKGWQGDNELFDPMPNTAEFLKNLSHKYEVHIFSTRNQLKISEWLIKHGLAKYISGITSNKEPAYLYIDDRAIKFDGDYSKTLEEIEKFRPHWK